MNNDPTPPSQARPRLDPTINYGHVLTVSRFLIAAASATMEYVPNCRTSISV